MTDPVEDAYRAARERLTRDECQAFYCPFCGGLVWACDPYTPYHFDSCAHNATAKVERARIAAQLERESERAQQILKVHASFYKDTI
jgi:hypothetical protein